MLRHGFWDESRCDAEDEPVMVRLERNRMNQRALALLGVSEFVVNWFPAYLVWLVMVYETLFAAYALLRWTYPAYGWMR
jgi:hypothetical protein